MYSTWIFSALMLWAAVSLMLGEVVIPFEWLYESVVVQDMSIRDAIGNDVVKGINFKMEDLDGR